MAIFVERLTRYTQIDKNIILEGLNNGEINIVIGTHSLIQKDVSFKKLGLVVTDEEHRFGVKQRENLAGKGIGTHILVMSATPIPRTLAIILYGSTYETFCITCCFSCLISSFSVSCVMKKSISSIGFSLSDS